MVLCQSVFKSGIQSMYLSVIESVFSKYSSQSRGMVLLDNNTGGSTWVSNGTVTGLIQACCPFARQGNPEMFYSTRFFDGFAISWVP